MMDLNKRDSNKRRMLKILHGNYIYQLARHWNNVKVGFPSELDYYNSLALVSTARSNFVYLYEKIYGE